MSPEPKFCENNSFSFNYTINWFDEKIDKHYLQTHFLITSKIFRENNSLCRNCGIYIISRILNKLSVKSTFSLTNRFIVSYFHVFLSWLSVNFYYVTSVNSYSVQRKQVDFTEFLQNDKKLFGLFFFQFQMNILLSNTILRYRLHDLQFRISNLVTASPNQMHS